MDVDIKCRILLKGTNEAVSGKKGCCSRNFMNLIYKRFPLSKSVDISNYFIDAARDGLHIIGHLVLFWIELQLCNW